MPHTPCLMPGFTGAARVSALVEEIERGKRVSPRELEGFRKVIKAIEEATTLEVRKP